MATDSPRMPPANLPFLSPPKREGEIGRLGDYRIYKQLGEGSMGVVLKADNRTTGELVAVKVLKPELMGTNSNAYERFMREIRITAALRHPNIVPTIDTGTVPVENIGDVPYMVMPYLQGEPIENYLLRLKRMPVADVLRVGIAAADGLMVAHEQPEPLIHRDIKPANIWLESGGGPPDPAGSFRSAKLLDFGLARAVEDKDGLSVSGMLVGTVNYMAPEQSRGMPMGPYTDIYALGATLYECLTGEKAVPGENMMQVLQNISYKDPIPPHELSPNIPLPVSRYVMRLLEKDPKDRPQSARDVGHALRALAAGRDLPTEETKAESPAKTGTVPSPAASPSRRGRFDLVLYSLGVMQLIGGGVFLWLGLQAQAIAPPTIPPDRQSTTVAPPPVTPPIVDQPKVTPPTLPAPMPKSDRPAIWNQLLEQPVLSLAVQPGTAIVAVGTADGTIHFLDSATGQSTGTALVGHTGAVRALVYSPDGKLLASGGDDMYLRVWDAAADNKSKLSKKIHSKPITALAFHPEGNKVVTGSEDSFVRLMDIVFGRPLKTYRGHEGPVQAVAISPKGDRLASAGEDGNIRIWDTANADQPVHTLSGSTMGRAALGFEPTKGAILAAAQGEADVVITDVATGKPVHSLIGHSLPVVSLTWSTDGQRLASGSEDDVIKVWDPTTGKRLLTLTGHRGPVRAVATGEGDRLYSGGDDRAVRAWEIR